MSDGITNKQGFIQPIPMKYKIPAIVVVLKPT